MEAWDALEARGAWEAWGLRALGRGETGEVVSELLDGVINSADALVDGAFRGVRGWNRVHLKPRTVQPRKTHVRACSGFR
jgi:hypothetical protein